MLAKYLHKLSANFNALVLTLSSWIIIAEGNTVFLAEVLLHKTKVGTGGK